MIPREVADFLRAGPALQVGTRDDGLVPECARAVGYRLDPGGGAVRVYVPQVTGGRTIANVRAWPRAAIVAAHPIDHRSLQLKGDVVAVAEAAEDERAAVLDYLATHGALLEMVGIPRAITRRVVAWPAWAIDVAVTDLFEQTPGPGAGERLREGAPR